jgi:hypothetical protein
MYRHHYGYGYGYGCGADEVIPPIAAPVAVTNVLPPPIETAPSPVAPAPPPVLVVPAPSTTPTPAMTPTPGVHDGMQYGIACIPIGFFPFPNP